MAAVLVQLALGAVYAWSVFNKPLQSEFGWSKSEVVLPFEVAIGVIFIGTFVGGRIQDRRGPRPVALAGVVLYSVGIMLASLVTSRTSCGCSCSPTASSAGSGSGLAYITPIAMLAKWFPDKRGLITGIAVGGFGFGAVITGPVAKNLLARDVAQAGRLPAARHRLPRRGADRRLRVPQPAGRVRRAGLGAVDDRPERRDHRRLRPAGRPCARRSGGC